jgi:hypothetical protein
MLRRTKRTFIVIVLAGLFVGLMAAGGLFLIGQTTSAPAVSVSDNPPIPSTEVHSVPANMKPDLPLMNLEGSWIFKNDKGGVFNATVADNSIEIRMESPDGTGMLYWNGTFDAVQPSDTVVVSDVLETKAILSNSKSKQFTVGNDTLSFDFSIQGKTTKVELRRV